MKKYVCSKKKKPNAKMRHVPNPRWPIFLFHVLPTTTTDYTTSYIKSLPVMTINILYSQITTKISQSHTKCIGMRYNIVLRGPRHAVL